MAPYYFKVTDNDGTNPADEPFDFPDLIEAIHQAKVVLAEMALDGLPRDPVTALEIEVQNAHHLPVARLQLELKIDFPAVTS